MTAKAALMHRIARQKNHFEHLYSPRMVEEIKEEKKMEHQTNSDMA